ncbi:MAG TPA: glycosyltransferase [Ilumatobacteraceae bacterium]|nr:glycosyltransferase [Ilumatobacteraceae bacterium]
MKAGGVPRFSICTPVHDPPLDLLRACLDSIAAQTITDWELCLVDDGSQRVEVLSELRSRVEGDVRIRLVERAEAGGIVAASNAALEMSVGEFVVLVDHDDRIEPNALEVVAAALDADPTIDYLYTDEDKLAPDGSVYDTFFKPDWSPERLRSQNYCTHLSVLRRSLVAEVGGFRDGFDGSQDHDLILRVTERARTVHHIPSVLYHWCITPGSAAGDADAKPYAREAGRRAVEEHLARLGIDGAVEQLETPGHYRSRRRLADPPMVSIVIPTVGTARPVWGVERPLVLGAVRSVLDVTTYPSFEIIVVADPGTPGEVLDDLDLLECMVVRASGEFNFSQRCNEGAAASTGDVLLFLNDDTLVEQADWLDTMVGFLAEPSVGVVGARLLYADGTLQHGGLLLNEQPLHIFHGFGGDDPGPFGLLEIDREVSAVTGACLLTPRRVFDELGGLPEEFRIAFNDLDYCLRVRATGRRIIWSAHSTLFHFESQTRRPDADQHEIDLLYERWPDELRCDPYGNQAFAPKQAVWLPRERATLLAAIRARLVQLRR